jgi:transposase-like protein
MDIHKNARLTPHGRERLAKMILSGQTPEAASEAVGVCPRTGRKWRDRFEQEGLAGLQDRSSRPTRLRKPTPPEVIECIESLRRQRMPGKEIATTVGVSPATVSRVLERLGLSKLSALEPAEPSRRYEREQPGELIHLDIKKLGKFNQIGHCITGDRKGRSNSRGVGWEYVHVCIDDASRVAFSKIMKTERKRCAVAFLKAAVAYYKSLGIAVLRVMTDNGSCCLRQGLPAPQAQAYPNKALHPAHQRQGRALHQDIVTRMGLCPRLSELRTARQRAALLHAPLQLASTSCQYRPNAPHHQTWPDQGQPVETPVPTN